MTQYDVATSETTVGWVLTDTVISTHSLDVVSSTVITDTVITTHSLDVVSSTVHH